MSSRFGVVFALLLGVLIATITIAVVVAFGPVPDRPGSPRPSLSLPPALTTGASSSPAAPSPSTGEVILPSPEAFGVGKAAPVLRVPKLGGGTINLVDLRGRPVWLAFISTTAPAVSDDLRLMNVAALRYADTGLIVLAIDVGETGPTVESFRDQLATTFPIGLDQDGAAHTAWRSLPLPVHYWIDRGGIVRVGALGGLAQDAVAESLQTILPDVTVSP